MRTLLHVVGLLFIVAGAACLIGGCALLTVNDAWITFLFGLAMMVIGWVIANAADKKTCPQCSESVKLKALRCRHCHHEFAAVA